MNESIIAAKIV